MMATEEGDIYFMSHENINIKYSELVESYIKVIDYLGKYSDSFSLITNLKKPYSRRPPNCEHDEILQHIRPYLEKEIIGIKEWPGTMTKENHKVMCIYKSCKETRAFFHTASNLFMAIQNHMPEDICFYRKNEPWFVTVSHEQLAFMLKPTKEDIDFLNDNNIHNY